MEISTKLSKRRLLMNNGLEIPIIGLGTYLVQSQSEINNAIKAAYDAGYRHIDSAVFYQNEKFIGNALKKYNIPREEMFITSKIPPAGMTGKETLRLVDQSLTNFDTDYLDLVLIHFPKANSVEDRRDVWNALEKCVDDGKIKSIGVSNFLPIHMKTILDICKIKPAVNQFELHPLFIDHETIEMCKKENIVIEAYSPFAKYEPKLIEHPVLNKISLNKKKSVNQILVRWSLQHGYICLPKSTKKERIEENINIDDFELTEEEMKELDDLNCNYKVSWDPRYVKF